MQVGLVPGDGGTQRLPRLIGIAHAAAKAGLRVVLIDSTLEAAQAGKARVEALLSKARSRGKLSDAQAAEVLGRIEPTTDYVALRDAQLVIEAVFEDREVKARVTRQAEAAVGADAVIASNTSTLPITGLAGACGRPDRFIGIHFFSPVDKMPLVEVIRGEATSDRALALALDFVKRLKRTPIVVNDVRGFYTTKVVSLSMLEGQAMLLEGIPPALIENAGRLWISWYERTFASNAGILRCIVQMGANDEPMRQLWLNRNASVVQAMLAESMGGVEMTAEERRTLLWAMRTVGGMLDQSLFDRYGLQTPSGREDPADLDALIEMHAVLTHRALYGCEPPTEELEHGDALLRLAGRIAR